MFFSTTPKGKRAERESERVVRGRSAERIKVKLTYDNEPSSTSFPSLPSRRLCKLHTARIVVVWVVPLRAATTRVVLKVVLPLISVSVDGTPFRRSGQHRLRERCLARMIVVPSRCLSQCLPRVRACSIHADTALLAFPREGAAPLPLRRRQAPPLLLAAPA